METQPKVKEDIAKTNLNQEIFKCTSCNVRTFNTYRGLNQHLRTCILKVQSPITTHPSRQPQPTIQESTNENNMTKFKWGCEDGNIVKERINCAYEKVVAWRKKLIHASNWFDWKRIHQRNNKACECLDRRKSDEQFCFKSHPCHAKFAVTEA